MTDVSEHLQEQNGHSHLAYKQQLNSVAGQVLTSVKAASLTCI